MDSNLIEKAKANPLIALVIVCSVAISAAVAVSSWFFERHLANVSSQYEALLAQKQLELDRLKTQLAASQPAPGPSNDYSQGADKGPSPEPGITQASLQVIIDAPTRNARVGQLADVRFRIIGAVPSNHKPTVIVRDPLGQYWSWGVSTTGRLRVQIGQPEDVSKTFHIVVLITNNDLPRGAPMAQLPTGIAYGSVPVVRK